LIVTPTIELACQIQREVDVLWPPTQVSFENEKNESNEMLKSSVFVVGANNFSSEHSQFQSEKEMRRNFPRENNTPIYRPRTPHCRHTKNAPHAVSRG